MLKPFSTVIDLRTVPQYIALLVHKTNGIEGIADVNPNDEGRFLDPCYNFYLDKLLL